MVTCQPAARPGAFYMHVTWRVRGTLALSRVTASPYCAMYAYATWRVCHRQQHTGEVTVAACPCTGAVDGGRHCCRSIGIACAPKHPAGCSAHAPTAALRRGDSMRLPPRPRTGLPKPSHPRLRLHLRLQKAVRHHRRNWPCLAVRAAYRLAHATRCGTVWCMVHDACMAQIHTPVPHVRPIVITRALL